MAEGVRFVCGSCSTMVEAWSDGNPYYLDPSSTRVPGSNAARRKPVGMGTQALGRIVTGRIIVAPTAPHDEGDPMEYPPQGGESAA